MKQWWESLNVREQRLGSALVLVVAMFLFYQLVWQPLSQGVIDSEKKLNRQQSLLTYVIEETARYKAIKQNSSVKATSGSLSSIVNRSARQNNVTLARIQPQNSDLQVWIDNISFNQLLTWLEQLANQQGIQVKAIDLTPGERAGQVRVKRLQLGR